MRDVFEKKALSQSESKVELRGDVGSVSTSIERWGASYPLSSVHPALTAVSSTPILPHHGPGKTTLRGGELRGNVTSRDTWHVTRDACQGEVSAGKLPEGAGVFSYRGDDEHGRMSYDGDWSNKVRAANEPSRRLRE